MSRFSFELEEVAWEGGAYLLPRVPVRFDGVAGVFPALIDTGAAVTVVHAGIVEMTGLTSKEIASKGIRVALAGVAGEVEGYVIPLTFTLGARRQVTLRDVPCVVSRDITDVVILGQQGALQRLYFEQHGPVSEGFLADVPPWALTS